MRILCKNVFNDFKTPCMEGLSRHCDYLPAVREIARIERDKIRGNKMVKKRNRYFNYLKSVNIHISDRETEFLCNSFVSRAISTVVD